MNKVWHAIAIGYICAAGCTAPPDMSQSAAIGPQMRPLNPPVGVLAVGGDPVMDRATAREMLKNPRPASAEVLNEGAELYRIYCAMCHGVTAVGDGALAEYFRQMPDLSAPYMQTGSFIRSSDKVDLTCLGTLIH